MNEDDVMFPTAEPCEALVPATTAGSRVQPINEAKIKAAMRDVGLTRLSVKKWRGQKAIGEALEQLGAVHVCAGEYVVSNHLRDEVVELIRKKLTENSVTIEQLAVLAKVMNDLLVSRDCATSNLLRSVQAGLVKDDPKPVGGSAMPPKGSQIVAVQINQTVTEPKHKG